MAAITKKQRYGHKILTVEARALILGLIIPIVGSIFHLIMVAMLNNGGHYQKIEIWPQNLNHLG